MIKFLKNSFKPLQNMLKSGKIESIWKMYYGYNGKLTYLRFKYYEHLHMVIIGQNF